MGGKDFGRFQFGCHHYKRRCKIRATCCNLIFPCRHCHNDAAVICSICQTEQEVAQFCSNCGVCMGEYFCHICKFFDDDTSKEQFHCDDCGICRVGGRDNCGACYSTGLRDKHSCIENSTKNSCPVCYEYLFDSVKVGHVMRCGHTMHMDCFEQMINEQQYRCPICSKSMVDMSLAWQSMDHEISATEMPLDYKFEVAMTATRGAIPCSTSWDTSAGIALHTTLAGSQLHKTRFVKQSDIYKFMNLGMILPTIEQYGGSGIVLATSK